MSKNMISNNSPHRYYLNDKQALAYFQQKPTPEFWDAHWKIDDFRNYLIYFSNDGLFIPTVKRYLSKGSVILEGGCGRGQLVYALHRQGYHAIGIDFARFANMRKMETEKIFNSNRLLPGDVQDPESYKVRRGKVGEYVSYLSKEDIRFIDNLIQKNISPFFGYNL